MNLDKWQLGLLVCNILLCIAGFALCFICAILIIFYHMDKLYYLHEGWFFIFPVMIGLIGGFVTIFAFIGIFSALFQNRIGMIAFSILMGSVIIPQLVSIYVAGKVTADVELEMSLQSESMRSHLETAIKQNDVGKLNAFFHLQRDFGCCGVDSKSGYTFWRNIPAPEVPVERPILKKNELPKSCCIQCDSSVCQCVTEKFFPTTNEKLADHPVFRVGCLHIIEMVYRRELKDMLDIGYMVFSIFCGILEFTAVFLNSLYIKVIRKRQREADIKLGIARNKRL